MSIRLPEFLNDVDALCDKMTKEQLECFVHETARVLAEGKREDFLSTLREYSMPMHSATTMRNDEELDSCLKKENLTKLKEQLKKIQQGELRLNSEYDCEYDDWRDDMEDEYYFYDPQKVVPIICNAIHVVHKSIDCERFDCGLEVARVLSSLEITVDGDYSSYDGSLFDFSRLYDYHLIEGKFVNVAKECIYLSYMGSSPSYRAEEVYSMFKKFYGTSVSLEDLLQMGNGDLPGFDHFLNQWIAKLASQNTHLAEKLLAEAQSMVQDETVLLENARKYCVTHPLLYKQLLEKWDSNNDYEKLRKHGWDALNGIPTNYTVRGEIALMVAKASKALGKEDDVDRCIFEAFASNSTVLNYLRLRFLTKGPEKYREKYLQVIRSLYAQKNQREHVYHYDEFRNNENYIGEGDYCTFLFWEGRFEEMYRLGIAGNQHLWSNVFTGEGVSLMLLLMYQGERLPQGLGEMLNSVKTGCHFNAKEYNLGKETQLNDLDVFQAIFTQWKNKAELLSEQERDVWLSRIEKLIAKRIQNVMNENNRYAYGSCAQFVAAYGEVLESLGHMNAKQEIMKAYKDKYPKRRLFIGELRNYGLVR